MMRRPIAPIVVLLLTSAAPIARADDEGENRKRIEAMPRERRLHLSEVLDKQFDALPPAERTAIRDLDASLVKLDPEVQARYRTLLRRYHVWAGGLDDAQRKQLADAGSIDARLALAAKWKKAEREADTRRRRNLVMGVHPGDLGTIPPFEMANALRVWIELNPRERAEVEKHDRIPQRLSALRMLGFKKRIFGRPFNDATEESLLARLENDERVKTTFPKWVAKREKKAEPDPAKKAVVLNPLHQLAESLYFMEHPPEPVSPAHLEQFDADIPVWLRATLDPLPPDDARRRLTILYRQIYPPGKEIPPPPKEDAAKKKGSPPPKAPAAQPSASPAPF
jgi:hypothetical protein